MTLDKAAIVTQLMPHVNSANVSKNTSVGLAFISAAKKAVQVK